MLFCLKYRIIYIFFFRSEILNHESENGFVMNGILDCVAMQACSVQLIGRLWKITLLLIPVLLKDWRTCESIPQRMCKKSFNLTFCLWRDGSVTFIYHKCNPKVTDFVIFLCPLLQSLGNHRLQLLPCRDNHLSVAICQTPNQGIHIFCVIHINRIVICIGLERHLRLHIQIFPVNQEYCLFYGRNIHQQIPCCLVRCHRLSGARCMPDIA